MSAYLLEEIAVFSLMYEQQEAIDIYPGTAIFAALVFQDKDTKGAPSGLGNRIKADDPTCARRSTTTSIVRIPFMDYIISIVQLIY